MGGKAFAAQGVVTPRMDTEAYTAIRDWAHEKLGAIFEIVKTPIEGPAKTSFGDVDVLVTSFMNDGVDAPDDFAAQHKEICSVLGAIKSKSEHPSLIQIAIPWPDHIADTIQNETPNGTAQDPAAIRGIQIDVRICKSIAQLHWLNFREAHGDLWIILGAMMRPSGLTLDDMGCHIRIPEIEKLDKKKAKVLLSADPSTFLSFLGLDEKVLAQRIPTEEAVFEYIASCRLLYLHDNENGTESRVDHGSNRQYKTNLATRPMFKTWFLEYLPAHPLTTTPPSRDTVREEAFAFFEGSQAAYRARQIEFRLAKQREHLFNDVIKPAVPVSDSPAVRQRRNCGLAALRKIVMLGDKDYDAITVPPDLKDADGIFDEEALKVWVREIWERVADVAWRVNQERCAVAMAKKREKAKAEAEAAAEAEAEVKAEVNAEVKAEANAEVKPEVNAEAKPGEMKPLPSDV